MNEIPTIFSTKNDLTIKTLRVYGLVQGVGFRPTVWRLANKLQLNGNVCNDGKGVLINLFATTETTEKFIQMLLDACPPLARIDNIERISSSSEITNNDFQIINSMPSDIATGVLADAATCLDCQQELMEPSDKRFEYPFINCTHCGPRFSIIRHMPYDRANTSMSAFSLCKSCQSEYQQPSDRRFHAQPTACKDCGPAAWLRDQTGAVMITEAVITETVKHLKQGAIIAIKGIGGIHLACNAHHREAIERLRLRKQRPHKPFAMMASNLAQIRRYCKLNKFEENALTDPASPIVILEALDAKLLPSSIAPHQKQWGFMLPYSPLHHLLMAKLDEPIVLTSGNRSNEPQCIENDDALNRLDGLADFYLLHNRPIENRIDDSVVKIMNNYPQILRRARGYAPGHMQLPVGFEDHPPLLALGGELKNTFCLLKNGHAILSQHMGDLEDAQTYTDYQKNIKLYLELYAHNPEILAVDNHTDYLSTKLGVQWSKDNDIPVLQIQHHHAHIAACMVDNHIDLDEGPVIGIVFDGLGLGDNGTLWGGEFLLAEYQSYKRLAHLKPVAMPGGSQAIREPWRNTWAQLNASFGWKAFVQEYASLELYKTLNNEPITTLEKMCQRKFNSPLASSAGRLFDAVAAAIGLAPRQCSFEGQAAMALEASIDKNAIALVTPYKFILNQQNETYVIDPTPMWRDLLRNLKTKTAVQIIASRFHRGLAQMIIDTGERLAVENKINRIALSGGVFQNRTLLELVVTGLKRRNLTVLTHRQTPTNDGGLALGQAVIAAARKINQKK